MDSKYLNQIIKLVESKIGLKPQVIHLSMWEEMLKKRMDHCKLCNEEAYLNFLIQSPDELQACIEQVVIPETWFFRDKKVFDFLACHADQMKGQDSVLKILSLACSTGEEPYSIAMTLFKAGFSKNEFLIDALDISKEALVKARRGIYNKNSFRNKEVSERDCYFHQINTGYVLKDQIKAQVHFYCRNIISDQLSIDSQSYHWIFCRNLLIYLNPEAQINTLNRIKNLLASQGVLIVSSAEAQIAQKSGFVSASPSLLCAFSLGQEPFAKNN